MKRLWRWTPVIVLLIFVGVAIMYSESLKTRVAIGAKAPDFELDLLNGGVVRSEQYLGKPVLVNFWAAWCPPCLEEMPAHDEFYRRYGHRIEYLAVNERETVNRIERHLNEVAELGLTMNLPIALDRRGTVGDAFRLGGMPETWLVDAEGIARQHWVGPITFEQMEAGYRAITGASPDAADGGPFHGTGDVRGIMMTDADVSGLWIGGRGGLARYDLADGTAAADDFEFVLYDDVYDLIRDDENPAEIRIVSAADDLGLPAPPSNVGVTPQGNVLAWVPDQGLFARDNLSQGEWRAVETELPRSMTYADLAPAPFTPGHWIMATAGGLFESRDGGTTWRATGFKERSFAAAFDPVAPRRLYIAAHNGVWVSEDDGRTATRLPASPQRTLVALDVVPGEEGDSVLVVSAPNGDVYVSRDSGRLWQGLIPSLPAT